MTPTPDPATRGRTPPRRRNRAAQGAAEAVAVILTAASVAGFTVYAERRAFARDLAEAWLREQGLAGVLSIERLDADGFSAGLRIGPAGDPDLEVERVEVDLGVEPAWADEPFKVSPRAIRLVRPRLKAELGPEGLTFGRLDPLVRQFLERPPDKDAVGPVVLIEDGSVRLQTTYGLVRLRGSGAVDDGRLVRLDARLRPVDLEGEAFAASLGDGYVRLTGAGDRLTGRATLDLRSLTGAGLEVEAGEATLELDTPYPDGGDDGGPLAVEGPLVLNATLDARSVGQGAARASGVVARASFEGRASGAVLTPTLNGAGRLSAAASAVAGPELDSREVRATAALSRLTLARTAVGWRSTLAGAGEVRAARMRVADGLLDAPVFTARSGGASVVQSGAAVKASGPIALTLTSPSFAGPQLTAAGLSAQAVTDVALLSGRATLRATAAAERLEAVLDGDPVVLRQVVGAFVGPAQGGAAGFRWTAAGSASAQGGFQPALASAFAARVPVLSGAESHRDDLERALAGFAIEAPALSLAVAPGRTAVATTTPIGIDAGSGARLTLTGAPLLSLAGERFTGDARLAAEGGGLPTLALMLSDWRAGTSGFASDVRLTASGLDAAIARNATADASGRATLAGGRFTFDAAGCIPVTAAEIELGENDLTGAAGEVCPTPGAPLVVADDAGYRLQGAFRQAAILWPVTEARVTAGEGGFDARGDAAGLMSAAVRLAGARVVDVAAERRYEPLRLSGGVALGAGVWRGTFDVATAARGSKVAEVALTHTDATGVGQALIDARGITFVAEGLQPGELTPLVTDLSTGAAGVIDFTGRLDWTPAGSTSAGRLTTRGLNFVSPAGAVSDVAADIELTSLTPLISAPRQRITVSRLDAVADVTELVTEFTLSETVLRLDTTAFEVADGRVRLEPFSIPLDGSGVYAGTVIVDGVQLGDLVEAVNLGEQVNLDAVVDGRIPFEIGPGRIRFSDGALTSRQAGRLSIRREALTGVAAATETTAPGAPIAPEAPVNAIQDFAYQAMENLAFERLSVAVNSLPEGRLGLLFKIEGEHDPAVAEEARVGFFEALRGRAFERRIPLPKGTPVNLTLDTTLNFDELLEALLKVARQRAAALNPTASSQPRSEAVQSPSPIYRSHDDPHSHKARTALDRDGRRCRRVHAYRPGAGRSDQHLRQAGRRRPRAPGQGSPGPHLAEPQPVLIVGTGEPLMNMLRNITFGAVAVAAIAGVAGASFAQTAAAKAAVDAAKAQGTVGEQGDGYIGFVSGGGDAALQSAVREINAGRAAAYRDIAAKTGVTAAAAGQATAEQLKDRLASGQMYKPLNGGWTRK